MKCMLLTHFLNSNELKKTVFYVRYFACLGNSLCTLCMHFTLNCNIYLMYLHVCNCTPRLLLLVYYTFSFTRQFFFFTSTVIQILNSIIIVLVHNHKIMVHTKQKFKIIFNLLIANLNSTQLKLSLLSIIYVKQFTYVYLLYIYILHIYIQVYMHDFLIVASL